MTTEYGNKERSAQQSPLLKVLNVCGGDVHFHIAKWTEMEDYHGKIPKEGGKRISIVQFIQQWRQPVHHNN